MSQLISTIIILATLAMTTMAQAEVRFNRDIRPILSQNCFPCHGPDAAARKGGLRLDLREDALKEAIIPGDIDASELVQRLTHSDPDELMPPVDSELSLSPEQIQTLTQWVAEGAAYEAHWAFMPLESPEIPNSAWSSNPIDRIVGAQLAEQELEPSTQAAPITLIRRLAYDLTGLPPAPEVVEAFVADPSDKHYFNLVEQYLNSPQHAERMAMDWLDVVRYADTNGYHSDEFRSVWPYRDYVIDSFKQNKPFDQFTIEQLAGDLLPNPTQEQRVGAAFNRLNQITAEGGAQAKEYLAMYAADRVRAAGTVWMGATMNCSECHDHKYDPYSMKDFYSMAAFFADIQEVGVYPGGSRWEPVLELPTDTHKAEQAKLQSEIDALKTALITPSPELEASQAIWEEKIRQDLRDNGRAWQAHKPIAMASANGTTFALQDDYSVLTGGKNPGKETYTLTLKSDLPKIWNVRLEALTDPAMGGKLTRGNGNFVLTEFEVAVKQGDSEPVKHEFFRAKADYEQADNHKIETTFDGNPDTGWAVNGHVESKPHAAAFQLKRAIKNTEDTRIIITLRHDSAHAQHAIGKFRIALSDQRKAPLSDVNDLPEPIATYARIEPALRSPEENRALQTHYLKTAPELNATRDELTKAEEALEAAKQSVPYVLATVATEPRTIRILPRGNWMDDSGDIVQPDTPAFLPPLNVEGRRATRLDFAQWLIRDDNPLTARVQMNRTWKLFFGEGISRVLDDLGSQGEWPDHPELLDWLATEFRDSGWDLRHMMRLIVTSKTYRQDSALSPDLQERDPFNRLLARQSRYRHQAEMVRDTALAVSGLLSDKVGGAYAFPYQPEGYWANCNTFRGPLIYTTSDGDEQYRRGLYTVWKRSFLHPAMLAFDAPNREECTAKRPISNTPLQALVLLNDPSYVEAAVAFAGRIVNEGGDDLGAKIRWAYQQILSRAPEAEEAKILAQLYHEHLQAYSEDTEAAQALLNAGQSITTPDNASAELAAWTSVARTLLNLHETITRA